MNETPAHLQDLHRLPLAALERLGSTCSSCKGRGEPMQMYHCYDERGRPMCHACDGAGYHGAKLLAALPTPALVLLVGELARELWMGDDPEASAEERGESVVAWTGRVHTSFVRVNGRVFRDYPRKLPFAIYAYRMRKAAPLADLNLRRAAAHALACRSLYATLLAEAGRRRILPTQADLLVAWDAALVSGNVRTDDDCRLLLAEAWAVCTLASIVSEQAQEDASAWLWSLQVALSPNRQDARAVEVRALSLHVTQGRVTRDAARPHEMALAVGGEAVAVVARAEAGDARIRATVQVRGPEGAVISTSLNWREQRHVHRGDGWQTIDHAALSHFTGTTDCTFAVRVVSLPSEADRDRAHWYAEIGELARDIVRGAAQDAAAGSVPDTIVLHEPQRGLSSVNARAFADAINRSGAPVVASVEGDRVRLSPLPEDPELLPPSFAEPEPIEPPRSRPVGPALARRLGRGRPGGRSSKAR